MIIKPKKEKQATPITVVKLTNTPGGKIIISGNGYMNSRRIDIMTADDNSCFYFLDNNKGYTVQHNKTGWNIPIHIKGLTNKELAALKYFVDQGDLKAKRTLYTFKDGRKEYLTTIYAPERTVDIGQIEIQDLLDYLKSRRVNNG